MKKTLKICILLFISLGILFVGSEVMAATTSITVDKPSITVGDTVTATIKYTAAAWDLKVTADNGLTTSSTTQYANTTDTAENESKSFTVKYTASKTGDLYIYLKGDVTDESSTTADSVSKKVKVTVREKVTTTDKKDETTTSKDTTTTEQPKEKSNNAYLKTLGVRITDKLAKEIGVKTDEYDFSGFSKNKTSYSVTVPKNVDSLKVIATAGENGTVKVSGNSGFEVGTNNKITIKVTSENGKTSKTYTIKVTQLAEEEKKPGNLIEDASDLYLTSLSIEGIELSPKFAVDTYSYTATLEDFNITELEVIAKANVEEAKIDISGNTELVEGENTINVLLTVEGSTVQTVYQIVVTKISAPDVVTDNPENTQSSTADIIGMFKGYIGIAVGVVVFMIVAVIVLIILLRRENKKAREDDEEYIEESGEVKAEEYNVYNNDENEFMDNEIEKDNFIESLYRQRNGNTYNEEELTEDDKETIEEINNQTEKIFEEKVEGQSVEYISNEEYDENPLEVRKKRRGKGKHSL